MDKYDILWNAFWNYCYDKGELHIREVIDKYIAEEKKKYNILIEKQDDKPLMTCGHVANAVDAATHEPCCVICNCHEIMQDKPDLTNRVAKCSTCGHITKSDFSLPFFEYRPNLQTDTYYCGCYGWD